MNLVRRLAVSLLLVAQLAPLVLAGSGAHPEIVDPEDQANPRIDIVSAWVTPEFSGLRFHVRLVQVDPSPKGISIGIGYDIDDGTRQAAIVTFDAAGKAHTIAARVGFGSDYPTPATYPDSLDGVEVTPGARGVVSALVPWGATPNFEPGRTMHLRYAISDDGSHSGGVDYSDITGDGGRIALVRGPPTTTQAIVAGAIGLVLLAAIVGGIVWLVVRRRARRGIVENAPVAAPSAPVPPSAAADPRDEARRMRLRPPSE